MSLTLQSPAFAQEERIPPKFTCDGDNISPPLEWSGVAEGVKSLVLICDDPDVPKEIKPDGVYDHWVLFNIPPQSTGIDEAGESGTPGNNSSNSWSYMGPCPPTQFGSPTHRYFFKLYALDTTLDLQRGASREDVEKGMAGHILDEASLMGTYSRKH